MKEVKNTKKQIIIIKTFIPLLLISLTLLISLSTVSANEIYVNTTGNDTSGTGTADNPYLTIQTGINNLDSDGTIRIANGQYSGVNNTEITINKNMTIIGESQIGTIINGTGNNWIYNIGEGVNVTIQNLTLTNGMGYLMDGLYYSGCVNNKGTCTLVNCTLSDNTAQMGGAIKNWYQGTCTVTGCTFTGNTANEGGAIYNQGNLTVPNCTFSQNQADYGGAICNYCYVTGGSGSVTSNVTGCIFTQNQADYGGAIYNYSFVVTAGSSSVNYTITRSYFTKNQGTYGGAIYNECFVNGLSGSATCTSTITESNFTENTATYGGAIINRCVLSLVGTLDSAACTSTINNSNFINNTATNDGGAIYNECLVLDGSAAVTCTVTESNFTDNTATYGGAIRNYNYVNGGVGSVNCTANFSRFHNNTATIYGNAIYNEGGSVDATLNWWGSNEHPSSQLYGSNIVYDPWIVLRTSADPDSIYNGQTSTVTVNLLYDSGILSDPDNPELYYHNPANGHVPDGIPVTFSLIDGPLGTLTSQTPFVNGTTSITFIANAVGVQQVNTTVDDENLTATINIDPCGHVNITKTVDNFVPNYLSLMTFTITAYNEGPDDVEGLVITDIIPDGLTLISADTHGTGSYNAGLWTVETLKNDTTATLTLVVNATSSGIFTNWANVTAQTTHDLKTWSQDYSIINVPTASYISINNEFRGTPWGNVINTTNYNDKIYAIIKAQNQGPDSTTSVDVLDLLDGLTWTGNYYVYRTVGSYPNTESAWVLNDPDYPFNGTNWDAGSLSNMIGNERWLAIEVIVNQTGTVFNYAETVNQSSYPYNGYDNDTAYLTVNIIPTSITVDNAQGNEGDTVTLRAVLTDYMGNALAGETVEFWIDNIKVGETTTDNTGTALLNYVIGQTPGKHTLMAVFNGNGFYQGSSATGLLYVPEDIPVTNNNSATARTVGMQNTGIPLAGMVLAIILVLGGFTNTRRKP